MRIKSVRSSTIEQTNITIVAVGPDSQHMAKLLREVIQRENAKRALQGNRRISYQIESAAG